MYMVQWTHFIPSASSSSFYCRRCSVFVYTVQWLEFFNKVAYYEHSGGLSSRTLIFQWGDDIWLYASLAPVGNKYPEDSMPSLSLEWLTHTVAASSGSTVMDDKLVQGTFIPQWPNSRSPWDRREGERTGDNGILSLDSMPLGNYAPLCLYCCICLSLSLYPYFSCILNLSFCLFQSLSPNTYQSIKMQQTKALAHS